MKLKLENLKYQDNAIQSVVKVFDGTEKNTFDNACFEGIRSNVSKLSIEQLQENIKSVTEENGIDVETAKLTNEKDLTIEMETGTGKTLVYIKTIYDLYKHYGFTKFIILVPSVAIRQGVLGTFRSFNSQLESIYGFKPNAFEYDSKKLSKVTNFIEDQHPQVMIMTLASFNSEDKILNQAQREDLFANIPFIDAIGKTNPIILMDEPQEGMDTENSIKQIAKLNPLFKIRYSATHKVVKNLLYRLTPYDSYKQGLVKKIEVLTVTEKNDEATIKIELAETQNGTSTPKAKLKAWHQSNSTNKFDFKLTAWLMVGDNLGEKTNNPSYLNYKIERINKSLKTGKWSVTFSNGVELFEKQTAGNLENIWALQLEWLIHRHFAKTQKLAANRIKCLSLIFIDRVANYMGETPIIKNLFVEKYRAIYPEYNNGKTPTAQHIQDVQGYYFAQKASGEYADNEGGVKEQGKIYELILKGKEELLTISNPVQFIFSHSALGVGWDNPNVFNIATLNTAYSEIRKRQEIGRGLRICVNQAGQRVYDALTIEDDERINQLTVIPNETYETFVTQYQEEIKAIYGSTKAGAGMTHSHKGIPQDEVYFKRNPSDTIDAAFKRFWKLLAKKTDYSVSIDENDLINEAIKELLTIEIEETQLIVTGGTIETLSQNEIQTNFSGTATYSTNANFSPLDLIEELSKNTSLSYVTTLKIIQGISANFKFVKNNPPKFIHEAAHKIKQIELYLMKRDLTYHITGEYHSNLKGEIEVDKLFEDYIFNTNKDSIVATPNKGVFDKMMIDSPTEYKFSEKADIDADVVCFIKLPAWYKIPTPLGNYEPDFGIVMKKKTLDQKDRPAFYFVVETKGTDDIKDMKALRGKEVYLIECAKKHFEALQIDLHYKAPIATFEEFKKQADKTINIVIEQ